MGSNDPTSAEEAWKTSSIILVSLPLGVTLFAAVVLLVVRPEPAAGPSFWEALWAGYAFLAVVGVVVLWRRAVRPHLPSPRTRAAGEAPYGRIQTGLIICMAIVEGTALFGVVTVFLGADRAVAVASVALVWIAWFVMRPRREWYGLR